MKKYTIELYSIDDLSIKSQGNAYQEHANYTHNGYLDDFEQFKTLCREEGKLFDIHGSDLSEIKCCGVVCIDA